MRLAEPCQGYGGVTNGCRSVSARDCGAYFFGAGFVLSCFGFLFFLSFFCELLPLPMMRSPEEVLRRGVGSNHPLHILTTIAVT